MMSLELVEKMMIIANVNEGDFDIKAKQCVAAFLVPEREKFFKLAIESFDRQLSLDDNEFLSVELADLGKCECYVHYEGVWLVPHWGEKILSPTEASCVANKYIPILRNFGHIVRNNLIVNQHNLSEYAVAYLFIGNKLTAAKEGQKLLFANKKQLEILSKLPYGKKIIRRMIFLEKTHPIFSLDSELLNWFRDCLTI